MLFAFFFNLVNGFINGYWFGRFSEGYDTSWFSDPRFILGIILFGLGYFVNQYHDRILINLRKNTKTGYVIPEGGLFKYISCPNFFGEMIEWAGFAVITWCLPSLSFFVWTFANLVPRAIDHHRWYKNTFPDYPAERKAIIPFIL
jgi:steroid 5-alpha reductase family enzyme